MQKWQPLDSDVHRANAGGQGGVARTSGHSSCAVEMSALRQKRSFHNPSFLRIGPW
jgi:hypothetical protein